MSEKYFSDDINALSVGEHIRMRPKMYFDKCFSENSLDALPFEVLCHAFDEYFDGNCNKIKLTVRKDSFTIKYNVGMPLTSSFGDLTKAEIMMTKIGACSNLKKHLAVGHEFCGLGMAAINYAAAKCKLTTCWEAEKGIFEFEDGGLIFKKIVSNDHNESFTEISVQPNRNLFGELNFTISGIKEKASEINTRLTNLKLMVDNKIE